MADALVVLDVQDDVDSEREGQEPVGQAAVYYANVLYLNCVKRGIEKVHASQMVDGEP